MKNKLSKAERQIVNEVLRQVIDALTWDEASQVYEDGGQIALSPEQMIFLASAAVKLVRHEAAQ